MNRGIVLSAIALPLEDLPAGAAEPSPAALTLAIARGDRDAFAAFYERWFDRVFATTRRLTRAGDADCLDVVHDVMLKVAQRMVPLADQRAVDAWMAKTILTTVLDRRRAETRRLARERVVAVPADATTGPDELADALLRDERIAWLRRELEQLPPRDRAALLARFRDDRSFAELGSALGISGDAAHGRIRRVLLRLAQRAQRVFGHA